MWGVAAGSAADPDSGVRVRAGRDDYGLPEALLPSLERSESRIRLIHTVDDHGTALFGTPVIVDGSKR
jgi:hypothetical protein